METINLVVLAARYNKLTALMWNKECATNEREREWNLTKFRVPCHKADILCMCILRMTTEMLLYSIKIVCKTGTVELNTCP